MKTVRLLEQLPKSSETSGGGGGEGRGGEGEAGAPGGDFPQAESNENDSSKFPQADVRIESAEVSPLVPEVGKEEFWDTRKPRGSCNIRGQLGL